VTGAAASGPDHQTDSVSAIVPNAKTALEPTPAEASEPGPDHQTDSVPTIVPNADIAPEPSPADATEPPATGLTTASPHVIENAVRVESRSVSRSGSVKYQIEMEGAATRQSIVAMAMGSERAARLPAPERCLVPR
jgi:hypothetical protein